jgi:hypothetical protein
MKKITVQVSKSTIATDSPALEAYAQQLKEMMPHIVMAAAHSAASTAPIVIVRTACNMREDGFTCETLLHNCDDAIAAQLHVFLAPTCGRFMEPHTVACDVLDVD